MPQTLPPRFLSPASEKKSLRPSRFLPQPSVSAASFRRPPAPRMALFRNTGDVNLTINGVTVAGFGYADLSPGYSLPPNQKVTNLWSPQLSRFPARASPVRPPRRRARLRFPLERPIITKSLPSILPGNRVPVRTSHLQLSPIPELCLILRSRRFPL
jgi:hypothetical protein